MSLHLVFNTAGYEACLKRKLSDDPIILLGDGVYCATQLEGGNIHALEIDAQVRGMSLAQSKAKPIDYDAFVALTELHSPVVSWAE
jgi:sulfur relay protein TusB/DsrH|tara:strand:+ start:1007 stop:1264 length:258 start_codon:yes stop_codon:yes gene_type:complete